MPLYLSSPPHACCIISRLSRITSPRWLSFSHSFLSSPPSRGLYFSFYGIPTHRFESLLMYMLDQSFSLSPSPSCCLFFSIVLYLLTPHTTPSLGFVSFIVIQLCGFRVRAHDRISCIFPNVCVNFAGNRRIGKWLFGIGLGTKQTSRSSNLPS